MSKLWFKRKKYGYGWYPVTWQGWLVIVIYLVLLFAMIASVEALDLSEELSAYIVIIVVTLTTSFLVSISYIKGEKPLRWQWGDKPIRQKRRKK